MVYNVQPPYNIISVNDVYFSRSIGTTYTNNTGRTMFVMASMRSETPLVTDNARVQAVMNGAAQNEMGLPPGVAGAVAMFAVNIVVPPGGTYRFSTILSGTGSVNVVGWIESY